MKNFETTNYSIFNFPRAVLDSIFEVNLRSSSNQNHRPILPAYNHTSSKNSLEQPKDSPSLISNTISCLLCGIRQFNSVSEQRQHFKDEEHQINLKKRISENLISSQKHFCSDSPDLALALGDTSYAQFQDEAVTEEHGKATYSRTLLLSESDKTENLSAKIWLTSANLPLSPKGCKNISSATATDTDAQTQVTQYGVFKAVIYDRKLKNKSDLQAMIEHLYLLQNTIELPKKLISRIPENRLASICNGANPKKYWAILQLSGGHFAGGVFDNTTQKLVAHKTFHRYTTRKKQGKSQLSHDKAKGQLAKSAGAQLRRYNEHKLLDDINQTITSWSQYLVNCSRVFQNTSKASRKVFFGGENSPIPYESDVIRVSPIQVKRPSLQEVSRVYEMLSSVFVRNLGIEYTRLEEFDTGTDASEGTSPRHANSQASENKNDSPVLHSSREQIENSEDDGFDTDGTLEPEPRPELVEFLYSAASTIQDLSKSNSEVLEFLETNKAMLLDAFLDPATELRYLEKCPIVNGSKTPTLLHLASLFGRNEAILFLLDHGDDPSITNGHPPLYSGGKTAYELSENRAIRDAFRKYRSENEIVYKTRSGAIIDGDKHSEWNATRIPRGWKEKENKRSENSSSAAASSKLGKAPNLDTSSKLASHSNLNTNTNLQTNAPTSKKQTGKQKPKAKKSGKGDEKEAKSDLVENLTKSLLDTSISSENPVTSSGKGILGVIKTKNPQWNIPNTNTQGVSGRMNTLGGARLSSSASMSSGTSTFRQSLGTASSSDRSSANSNTNKCSDKKEHDRHRELRAKAAEARFAKLSTNAK